MLNGSRLLMLGLVLPSVFAQADDRTTPWGGVRPFKIQCSDQVIDVRQFPEKRECSAKGIAVSSEEIAKKWSTPALESASKLEVDLQSLAEFNLMASRLWKEWQDCFGDAELARNHYSTYYRDLRAKSVKINCTNDRDPELLYKSLYQFKMNFAQFVATSKFVTGQWDKKMPEFHPLLAQVMIEFLTSIPIYDGIDQNKKGGFLANFANTLVGIFTLRETHFSKPDDILGLNPKGEFYNGRLIANTVILLRHFPLANCNELGFWQNKTKVILWGLHQSALKQEFVLPWGPELTETAFQVKLFHNDSIQVCDFFTYSLMEWPNYVKEFRLF